jgi:hypothetical protein
MSKDTIVARAGMQGFTAEQVSTLAQHLGLPATTPVADVAARINAGPALPSAEITRELNAAVTDYRIPERATPRWRSILASRGEAGRTELRSLTPVRPSAAKAATAPKAPESDPEPPSLLERRPVSLAASVDAGAAARKVPRVTQVAASSAADPRVVSDPVSGALSWNGLPVSAGSDGSQLVHTTNGAMTVDAFKAAGLDAESEAVAVGLSRLTGTASKTDLPRRNPLFGGS